MRNWKLSCVLGATFALGIALQVIACCRSDTTTRGGDDDDTSSPTFGARTYGNVPLSQQQVRSAGAGAAAAPGRTFGNVPLSKQKPHKVD